MNREIENYLCSCCSNEPGFLKNLIVEIFKGGCDYGNDESTSYDWGEKPYTTKEAQLLDRLYDFLKDKFEYQDMKEFVESLGL